MRAKPQKYKQVPFLKIERSTEDGLKVSRNVCNLFNKLIITHRQQRGLALIGPSTTVHFC